MITDRETTNEHQGGRLESPSLSGTQVTEEDIEKLRQALPNCEICRWPTAALAFNPASIRRRFAAILPSKIWTYPTRVTT